MKNFPRTGASPILHLPKLAGFSGPLAEDPLARIALSKAESLRQMSERLRAAAAAAVEATARRHYAMRALELAQEAEALERRSRD
jgi:hypothetical protein